jgi:hypothetical protein
VCQRNAMDTESRRSRVAKAAPRPLRTFVTIGQTGLRTVTKIDIPRAFYAQQGTASEQSVTHGTPRATRESLAMWPPNTELESVKAGR